MVKQYTPKLGDIVLLNFNPQSGHEQKGRRPALVISDSKFNSKTNLAIVCPITLQDNGFIFHVPLSKKQKTSGFVLVEHAKSLDYRSRKMKYIERCNKSTLEDAQYLVKVVLKFV